VCRDFKRVEGIIPWESVQQLQEGEGSNCQGKCAGTSRGGRG